MNFVYELLRAGTTQANSDSGSEVARKINDNFKNVQNKFTELDKTIQEGVTVNVPIGDATTAGIVKSSDSENMVTIGKDGTMEVVSLNVNKLKQDNGDYIILDGNV
ncbi:hypothetical protein [Flintibacter muris]|uniref:hypothetical protein n=1 Tax=Flintibacter muris TaxID=2941327 RepID=UPI00203F22B1|nr:hypothetical protein [Flintibacter muris]